MKDQTEKIQKELAGAIRAEVSVLEKKGLTRKKIAKLAGVQLPFLSNFMSGNVESINGLAIPRLVRVASGLNLKIELTIQKKEASGEV